MGKMKEVLMDMIQKEYGSYENYQRTLNEDAATQWVHKDTPCPNCNRETLMQNEDLAINCDACGQSYIEVDNALRFK
tara:strand:- start:967 stop:1197 length:231 start_codon:yes stop_codon:yes gene_type:complete